MTKTPKFYCVSELTQRPIKNVAHLGKVTPTVHMNQLEVYVPNTCYVVLKCVKQIL